MRRKVQKMMKYVVWISIFLGLVMAQFVFLYAFEKREKNRVSVLYTDPITQESVSYEKKFTISTPFSFSGRLPTVILLHGDLVDQKSLNFVKSEFVRQGYLVVTFEIDFTYKTYLEIDAVVNHLLIHSSVDHDKIGLFGHSHGGHFAFWYAKMHPDVIQSLIMANMGSFRQLYDDFYEYYNYFVNTTYDISFRDYITSFKESITADNPRNLLVITDNYSPLRYADIVEQEVVAWNFTQENVIFGNFENGTARELNTQYKMFMHGSGLYNPLTIGKNIDWMNAALGVSIESIARLPISLRIYIFFVFVIALVVLGVGLMYSSLRLIPIQLSWIKNRLHLRRKTRTNKVEMEIPPVLKIDDDIEYKKDIFRLERRFSREFDYIHDMSEYFRIIVIGIIGTHLFLYLLELMLGENSLYYVAENNFNNVLGSVYSLNDKLNSVLFTHPLSFQIMYFWILIVFFIRRLRIKDPRIQKLKMNILDVPNIILLALEIFLVFWVFGYVTIYNWLGLNFWESGLNILLRFAVLYYIHFVIVEFVYNQSSKPNSYDRRTYIFTALFILLMYLPITIPTISILIRAYRYAVYFIIPYFITTGTVMVFSIFGKKNIFAVTLFNFFLLLFWKYNMYYWILF